MPVTLLALLCRLGLWLGVAADEIRVAVAGNFLVPVKEIARSFEAEAQIRPGSRYAYALGVLALWVPAAGSGDGEARARRTACQPVTTLHGFLPGADPCSTTHPLGIFDAQTARETPIRGRSTGRRALPRARQCASGSRKTHATAIRNQPTPLSVLFGVPAGRSPIPVSTRQCAGGSHRVRSCRSSICRCPLI